MLLHFGKVYQVHLENDECDSRDKRHSSKQSDVWGRTFGLETRCRQRIFAASTRRRHSKDPRRHWKDQSSPWSKNPNWAENFILQLNLFLAQNVNKSIVRSKTDFNCRCWHHKRKSRFGHWKCNRAFIWSPVNNNCIQWDNLE